jgi:hypothetical protein
MPWELTNLPMLIYLLYLTWFWYRYNRASKRSLALALPLLALTLLSLKSRRLIPFFILLSVNQLPLVLSKLPQRIRNWLPLAYGLVMLTSFLTFKPQTILHQTWASYCQTQVLCSENVVSFLTNAHFTGRILNAYRLGGHLIYRYPQAQVFIDGRMTLWADNSGVYPFQTYLDIVHTTPVGKQALQTLAPDLVIVHPQFELAPYLETLGWPKVFSDDTVNVYQNPLSQKLLVQ